jgi:hypothetical protein
MFRCSTCRRLRVYVHSQQVGEGMVTVDVLHEETEGLWLVGHNEPEMQVPLGQVQRVVPHDYSERIVPDRR